MGGAPAQSNPGKAIKYQLFVCIISGFFGILPDEHEEPFFWLKVVFCNKNRNAFRTDPDSFSFQNVLSAQAQRNVVSVSQRIAASKMTTGSVHGGTTRAQNRDLMQQKETEFYFMLYVDRDTIGYFRKN